jgi:hypothetical protein
MALLNNNRTPYGGMSKNTSAKKSTGSKKKSNSKAVGKVSLEKGNERRLNIEPIENGFLMTESGSIGH